MIHPRRNLVLALALTVAVLHTAHASNFIDLAFNPAPKVNDRRGWAIQNFGPVGIGIQLEQGFNMKINNVEVGSPAAKTGQLEKGQVIESINGVSLKDRSHDPRKVLAQLITNAEASDGRIDLLIKNKGKVTVTIPVFGEYSPSWPLNCPKSEKIVRNLADRIIEHDKNEWSGMLFLLSTGEEKDLAVVRQWIQNGADAGNMNWSVGMTGLAFCEYYLRTGDKSVLPRIQAGADHLRDTIYNGGWAGRGLGSYPYQNGGHVNASGVHCLTYLLMAKTCGVDVDEFTLQSSLRHFYRYSGRGSVPYGDFTSKPGYGDCNGKTSGLALAMAAATNLTPEGENSIYAQAAEINAMKSYYGITTYHMGHTGGGLGEIWKSASMGLMMDKRPEQYREYMNARRWILELSRRHDGGIGIAGGKEANYDKSVGSHRIAWGTYFALNYTLPRKQLQLFGAPRSPYAKSYQLPKRPWGNPLDDAFSSSYPVPGGPWGKSKVFEETVHDNVGDPVTQLLRSKDVSNRDIITYLHHPEITHRFEAKEAVVRLKKDEFILGMLLSPDPRMQHVGVMALHDLYGTWHSKNADPSRVTDKMMERVEQLIRDPNGSWYVKQWALGLLEHSDIGHLRTFKDLLVELIEHEEHWIQGSAISSSIPLLNDKSSYKDLFPPIARAIGKATAFPIVNRARYITEGLNDADPEIQKYGLELMKQVYKALPTVMYGESGIAVIKGGAPIKRKAFAEVIAFSDEGREFVKRLPKESLKSYLSGNDADMYTYTGQAPNEQLVGTWYWAVWPRPKTPEGTEDAILSWLKKLKFENGKVLHTDLKDTLVLEKNGKTSKTRHLSNFTFWSGDTLISSSLGAARKMKIFQTREGVDFLLIEEPDFEKALNKQGLDSENPPKDFNPGYTIYIRKEHTTQE